MPRTTPTLEPSGIAIFYKLALKNLFQKGTGRKHRLLPIAVLPNA